VIFGGGDLIIVSAKLPKSRFVDVIPILIKLQISYLGVVKSSKSFFPPFPRKYRLDRLLEPLFLSKKRPYRASFRDDLSLVYLI
jgi:hypothetical protein